MSQRKFMKGSKSMVCLAYPIAASHVGIPSIPVSAAYGYGTIRKLGRRASSTVTFHAFTHKCVLSSSCSLNEVKAVMG